MRKIVYMKRSLAVLLIVAVFLSTVLVVSPAQNVYASVGWDGSRKTEVQPDGDTYQISSADEFAWFAARVNSGETFSDKTIIISDFIDLNGYAWTPIGGTINGKLIFRNCNISGLVSSAGGGLFGSITLSDMLIDNVVIEDANIGGANNLGIIASSLTLAKGGYVKIDQSVINGGITCGHYKDWSHGGLFGRLDFREEGNLDISNSDIDVSINSDGWAAVAAGGIIGTVSGGNSKTKINLDKVHINTKIENVHRKGYSGATSGGVVGQASGGSYTINECSVTGKINSVAYTCYSGSYFGCANLTSLIMKNSYSTCPVRVEFTNMYGSNFFCGGFISGGNCSDLANSIIENCYYAGKVEGSGSAFLGGRFSSNITIKNCVFDTAVTGLQSTNMVRGKAVSTCKGVPTYAMSNQSTFEGWDFDAVWVMGKKYPKLLALPYDEDFFELDEESLNEYLRVLLTNKGNASTIQYLAKDENFTSSAFVHENDTKFASFVTMLLSDAIYRGIDGWKDIFNGATAKQQAEEVLAKLLYDYQAECEAISYAKTAKKFSKTLTSGLEDYLQATALEMSISNKDIKNLNESLSPDVLGTVFKEHKYSYLEGYLTTVKGYSKDDDTVKLLNNYLESESVIKSYKENFKYLGDGIDVIKMTNDTIGKLYEFDALYNSGELYSEMLLYIKDNCVYDVVCDAAEELYSVIHGSFKDQLEYVSRPLLEKAEEGVIDYTIDKLLETSIGKMNYAFIIKKGFDWGVDIANFVFHTGEVQELRDKMRTLAYLGTCLSQWMLESNIEYFQATTNDQKESLGLKAYYAAYMLWQTRVAGEDALQGFAEKQASTSKRYYQVSKGISKTLHSLKLTMFTRSNRAKLLTLVIACPVDAEIQDGNGNPVTKITDGVETDFSSTDFDYAVVYDEVSKDYIKILNFCDADEYKVQCTGHDLGQVDIHLMRITDDGKMEISYIDDIAVENGTVVKLPSLNDNSKVTVNNHDEQKEYNFLRSDSEYVPLETVLLEKHTIEIKVGEKVRLAKAVTPANASDKIFYWNTDNKSCADVNSDGVICGLSGGQAIVTVSALDGTLLDSCRVSVKGGSGTGGDQSGTGTGNGSNTSTDSGSPTYPTEPLIPANPDVPTNPVESDENDLKPSPLYYVVKFDANGGTKLQRKTMTLLVGDNLGILPKAKRKGYAFEGWYTQKNGGVRVNRSTVLNVDTTLYAHWSKVAKPAKMKAPILKSKKEGQVLLCLKKIRGIKGYEITYSTNKSFKPSLTAKVRTSSLKKILKKLTVGKKYYVKVRAYRIDSTGKRVYGAYSPIKSIWVK